MIVYGIIYTRLTLTSIGCLSVSMPPTILYSRIGLVSGSDAFKHVTISSVIHIDRLSTSIYKSTQPHL